MTVQLADGCGYTGRDFGAPYPDSQCYGGRLFDMDKCDDKGNLTITGFEPLCPNCRHKEWLAVVLMFCNEEGWVASEAGEEKECPYTADNIRFPEDLEVMRGAWLEGYETNKRGDP
jgi:hypothetical protein